MPTPNLDPTGESLTAPTNDLLITNRGRWPIQSDSPLPTVARSARVIARWRSPVWTRVPV